MKTPEETKKGLECCVFDDVENRYPNCSGCPYENHTNCENRLRSDSLAYIQQLESSYSQVKKALSDNGFASLEAFLQAYNQVKAERDAAIEELERVLEKVENAADFIDEEIYYDLDYGTYRNLRDVVDDIAIWENEDKWRGVCEENGGADNAQAD